MNECKICKRCGIQIEDEMNFCPKCGEKVHVQQNSMGFQGQMPNQGNYFSAPNVNIKKKDSILSVIAILISLIGCGYFSIIGGILGLLDIIIGKKKKDRRILCSVAAIFVSVGMTYMGIQIFGDNSNEKAKNDSLKNSTEIAENIGIDKEDANSYDFSEENKKFKNGKYKFIKNKDLDKYCANMDGTKIYVVTVVDDIKEDDLFQSNLSDGYMMSNFHVGENFNTYKSFINKGDLVAIAGTVTGYDNYSITGTSVDVSDCIIFAVGEKAKEYRKKKSDKSLKKYFKMTEDVAKTNDDISEDEYKGLCKKLEYEKILRNPDDYEGKYCKLSGTVSQVIEGWFDSFTIYIKDSEGNIWGCTYSYNDGEEHVMEGDSITVYGKCEGTDTTETILGKQVTIPRIDIKYIN